MVKFFLLLLVISFGISLTNRSMHEESIAQLLGTIPNEMVYAIFLNGSPEGKTASQVWLWIWAFDKIFTSSFLPIEPVVKKYARWGHHKLINGTLKNTGILTAFTTFRHLSPRTSSYLHKLFICDFKIHNCHLIHLEKYPYYIPKESINSWLQNKEPLNLGTFGLITDTKKYYYLRGEEDTEISKIQVLHPLYHVPYQQNLIRIASINHHNEDPAKNGACLLFIRDLEKLAINYLLLIQLPVFGQESTQSSSPKDHIITSPRISHRNKFFDWLSTELLKIIGDCKNTDIQKRLNDTLSQLRHKNGLPQVVVMCASQQPIKEWFKKKFFGKKKE